MPNMSLKNAIRQHLAKVDKQLIELNRYYNQLDQDPYLAVGRDGRPVLESLLLAKSQCLLALTNLEAR